MISTKSLKTKLQATSYWVFVGLLAYMPVHIFMSTWLGSSFGLLDPARILKDIVMLLGFFIALGLSIKQKWFTELVKQKLVWLILAYGALTVLLAVVKPTDQDAEILGIVYNTRFLMFFLYAILLSNLSDSKKLRKHSLMAVFASALIVLVFGLIQYTVMPSTFLEHFGYRRSNGVLPAFFIDDKPDLERIMSTVRDPNSYGSYLIIIGSLSLSLFIKRKALRNISIGFLALTGLNLIFTFSRSAWIGFILAVALIGALSLKEHVTKKQIKTISIIIAIFIVLTSIVLAVSWNSYFIQNVIFHADQKTVLEDPNQLRIRFWKESLDKIVSNPAGTGPGTAGLASIRNNVQGTKLNENYYLQIASEIGILGLILFLAIIVLVAIKLLELTYKDWVALALFASLSGLMITNFLVHIWSNEAVAYTWWGLAGVVLGAKIVGNSHNKSRQKN